MSRFSRHDLLPGKISALILFTEILFGVILEQDIMPCYGVINQSQLSFQSKLLLYLDWIPDGFQLPIMNLNCTRWTKAPHHESDVCLTCITFIHLGLMLIIIFPTSISKFPTSISIVITNLNLSIWYHQLSQISIVRYY